METDDFLSRVATGDGCWEWTGTRNSHGYGVFWDGQRQVRAHRAAWARENGPIPDGLSVLHSCDNRGCVRPDHLRVGTQRDNMADMDLRKRRFSPWVGRVQAGEQNGNAHLTREQVAQIRGLAAAGYYQDEIAARFGITQPNVSVIVRGKSWADVEAVSFPPAIRDRPTGRSAKRKKAANPVSSRDLP